MIKATKSFSTLNLLFQFIIGFLLAMTCSNCSEGVKKEEVVWDVEELVPKSNKKIKSKYASINASQVLEQKFKTCVPENHEITEQRNFKNQTAGDYDGDGIYELAMIVRNQEKVKLVIIERDTLGNCSQKFITGDLTDKLLDDKLSWKIANTMTTRFGGPGGTTENLKFFFNSEIFNLELQFYGDPVDNNYYLLKTEYVKHENSKDKSGQVIAQDFLKQEKKTMVKIGSRKDMIVEKIPKKRYTLKELNYKTILELVQ